MLYSISFGQTSDIVLEQLTTADGLSHNTINAIYQDKKLTDLTDMMEGSKGQLWIDTACGLSLYDRNMDNFTNNTYADQIEDRFQTTTLKDFVGAAYRITEDRDGFLWNGTILDGVVRFDSDTGLSKIFSTTPFEVAGSFDDSAVDVIKVENEPGKQFCSATSERAF